MISGAKFMNHMTLNNATYSINLSKLEIAHLDIPVCLHVKSQNLHLKFLLKVNCDAQYQV